MLIVLALIAQTTPLNAEAQKALACASAVAVPFMSNENVPLLTLTAQYTYFTMAAAKADPGSGPFNERVNALSAAAQALPVPGAAEAATLLAECDRLYPAARRTRNAALPADPYERDLACHGAAVVMEGGAMALAQQGKPEYQGRYKGMYDYFGNRLATAFTERKLDGPGIGREVDKGMLISLTLGNTEAIANSCMALLPAS